MNFLKSLGLITRIAILSLGMTVTILVAFLIFAGNKSRTSLAETLAENLEAKTSLVALDFNHYLEQATQISARAANHPGFQGDDAEALTAELRGLVGAYELLAEATVIDGDKRVLASTNSEHTTAQAALDAEAAAAEGDGGDADVADISLDDMFGSSDDSEEEALTGTFPHAEARTAMDAALGALRGAVYFSEAYDAGGVTVLLATPIYNDEGVAGALLLELEMSVLQASVDAYDQSIIGDKHVYLLDGDSKIILSGDSAQKSFDAWKDKEAATFSGKRGSVQYVDAAGDRVLAGFTHLEKQGASESNGWNLVAVAPEDALFEAASEFESELVVFTSIAVGLALVVLAIFVRLFIVPLTVAQRAELEQTVKTLQANQEMMEESSREMEELRARENAQVEEQREKANALLGTLEMVEGGDLTAEITVQGDDVIGRIGKALQGVLANMRGSMTTISENAKNLGEAAEELKTVSERMSQDAENTAMLSNQAVSAAQQVRDAMVTVSDRVSDISNKTSQIRSNTEEAAGVAENAVTLGKTTKTTIANLGKSSAEIGNVLDVIKGIAEQTNLLALNATIEAASAGDAGKGFAVVASEVKNLAKQTAAATGGINERIGAIQSESSNSEQAILQIANTLEEINAIQGTVSNSIQDQADAIMDIADRVNESAAGNDQITENLQQVNEASQGTLSAASDITNAFYRLNRVVNKMRGVVNRFEI